MADKINWNQVGTDFQQKYEGTFCRYRSPISSQKEVFQIASVTVNVKSPPDLCLYNDRAGELYLAYNTEAELDFSFPEVGYFQRGKRAVMFTRNYERQWRKGMCNSTVKIVFPYNDLMMLYPPHVDEKTIEAAFQPRPIVSITEADRAITEGQVSVALTKHLALGVGDKASDRWLWFDAEPIAAVLTNGTIEVKVPTFAQEIRDYLRLIGDHQRAIV